MITSFRSLPTYKQVIAGVLAANVLVTLILLIIHFCELHTGEVERVERQEAETSEAVEFIHGKLQLLEDIASDLAIQLAATPVPDVQAKLKEIKAQHPEVFGIGAAFAPHEFDPNRRLYAPYHVNRMGGEPEMLQVEDQYDYTIEGPDTAWYTRQIASKQGIWQEPYFGRASEDFLANFTAPIIRDDKIIGVTTVNYSVKGLDNMIATLNIGHSGYCVLASTKEKFVYHPNRLMIKENRDVMGYLKQFGSRAAAEVRSSLDQAESGSVDITNATTGEELRLRHSNLGDSNWTLLVFFGRDDQPEMIQARWRRICWIGAFSLMAFISLAFLVFYREGHDEWDLVVVTSVAFVIAISLTLRVVHFQPPVRLNGSPIVDSSGMEQFKHSYESASLARKDTAPIFIPTGLFVQSIEFASANNVILTGYVWQKYDQDLQGKIREGVVFPEAESVETEEAYRKEYGNYHVIGWYFRVNLRQRFDYEQFPMQYNDVWVRLWHKDFDQNAVLTPDLAAYDKVKPQERPGVERDFVLPGWRLMGSYYSIRENSYGSNFGMENYVGQNNFPEMYFNISIKRQVMGPIIKHFVPLIVVLVTLFLMLMVSDKTLDQAYGFNSLAVIAIATGLFFVAIFQHIDLRNSLSGSRVIYLEYFYFLTYAAILLVSVNSIINVTQGMDGTSNATKPTHRNLLAAILYLPIQYSRAAAKKLLRAMNAANGRLLKYLFWPMLTGSFWLVTVCVYY